MLVSVESIIICDDSGTGKSHTCGRVGDRNRIKINNNTNRKREGQKEGEREFRGAPYARAGLEKRVQERREREKGRKKKEKKITKLQ